MVIVLPHNRLRPFLCILTILFLVAAGGSSDEENLWLACAWCNGYKLDRTHGYDPLSQQTVPLFNPRHQVWSDHFQWREDGTEIIGHTACGRATVIILKLNNRYLRAARRKWVLAGWHPPRD